MGRDLDGLVGSWGGYHRTIKCVVRGTMPINHLRAVGVRRIPNLEATPVSAGLGGAARLDGIDKAIYCIIGDGESGEGHPPRVLFSIPCGNDT